MEDRNIFNSKIVKQIVKSTFVIIGMFVVLSFGFATLVLFYGSKAIGDKLFDIILCCILIGLPIIVFIGFFFIVKYIYKKLRCFFTVNDTTGLIKIIIKDKMGIDNVKTTNRVLYFLNSEKWRLDQLDQYELMIVEPNSGEARIWIPKQSYELPSKIDSDFGESKNNVLWIGSRCGGSINCENATTINEALNLLKSNNYIAIVYDLEHNDHDEEKNKFINDIKMMGIKIPIFEADRSIA